MPSRQSLAGWSGALLLGFAIAAPAVFAQARPDIFVTPVANAPFKGVVQVERSIVQSDGALVNLRTIREIGRDSQGRIHNESRMLVSVSDNVIPAIQSIHLYDPVSRTTAYLDPANKTFSTAIVNHPPSTEPPQLLASPTARSLPQSQFTREEDLGMREIAGVLAHGVRETQEIPAEASGMGKEIPVTDEFWYSDDLHMNLIVKHSDPRTGSVAMTVTQLNRNEPNPAFFAIPADYTQAKPVQGAAR
ncbi:hypothetical protein [Acidicapsa acidisoli]|uniref:hypothetical protein n=1 Tax=Acidicapsa acidisoli TaxID=1615681 RepID=UPI0021E0678C|nr:hypothetical protein [Acidicapsa acidisoli]